MANWKREIVGNDPHIPQAKMLRLFDLINYMAIRKRRITEIAERLDHNTRTAYRYLHLLDAIGFEVVREFRTGSVWYSLSKEVRPEFINAFSGKEAAHA